MSVISRENVQKYLKKKYPLSKIEFTGEGWTSLAYIVDNEIFRFCKISIEDYKREAQILSVVRPFCNVSVPDIKIVSDGDFSYSIHRCLLGKTWNLEEFEQLEETKQKYLASDCATFLMGLHSIDVNIFRSKVSPKRQVNKRLPSEKSDFYPLLSSKMSKYELDKLYELYMESLSTFKHDPVVLHRDFEGKNCLVDENFRLIGVFDFGNSSIGDRTREFSFLYNRQYPTFLNKLLAEYENVSGIKIEVSDLKDYLLRSAIDSLSELSCEALESIRGEALESRIKLFRFFLEED